MLGITSLIDRRSAREILASILLAGRDKLDLDQVRREAAPEELLAHLRLRHLVPDLLPLRVLRVRQEATSKCRCACG